MKIENIPKPKGAHKSPKRIGRGSGSGHGKTSGRGHKGASSRSGATLRLGFEGGQMSLIRRLPKRGFTNIGKRTYNIINVARLNHFRKDSVVDAKAMHEAGFIKNTRCPVKILGEGKLSKPLKITASAVSKSAKKKILEAGGTIELKPQKEKC